jgi:protein-tyrosine phosphatase
MRLFRSFLIPFVAIMGISLPAKALDTVKILFVDTGNTGRSVTAEALAKVIIHDRHLPVLVISRAVDEDPFETAPEANVVTILSKRGIDVSGHQAAQVIENDVRHATLILTMTAKHKARLLALYPAIADHVFTLAEYATGEAKDVDDAYGKPVEFYENMVSQVDGYIAGALDKATAAK